MFYSVNIMYISFAFLMFSKVKDNNFSSAEHGSLIGCMAILRFS